MSPIYIKNVFLNLKVSTQNLSKSVGGTPKKKFENLCTRPIEWLLPNHSVHRTYTVVITIANKSTDTLHS